MNRMLKYLMIGLLFAAAGCSGTKGISRPSLATPTAGNSLASPVSPSPSGPTAVLQNATASIMTSQCSLLNSYDLANLFATHTEVVRPKPQVSQVSHVIFSPQSVSANEISCIYYVYHLPGSITGQTLQVSYWLDTPAQAAPSAWTQVWTTASAGASQSVSGIGDGAFYQNGNLTFKKGDTYMTVNVTGTGNTYDTSTPAGVQAQLKVEKEVALDALKHF